MSPWLRALWRQTWQRAIWHTICVIGGALTIANEVSLRWQRLAVCVVTVLVVLPHLLEAWQDIRQDISRSQSLRRKRRSLPLTPNQAGGDLIRRTDRAP